MLRQGPWLRAVGRRIIRAAPRRWLSPPAPSAAWDPSTASHKATGGPITLTVKLPEDAVLTLSAEVGQSIMESLEAADLSDVWPGGACGGACNCSTCRIVVIDAPCPPLARSEEEEDMLDTAATAHAKMVGNTVLESFLADDSRLACQWILRKEDDGLTIELPDDVCNMLEVPLWLRGSR